MYDSTEYSCETWTPEMECVWFEDFESSVLVKGVRVLSKTLHGQNRHDLVIQKLPKSGP